jgi:hypothetical protein
MKKETKTIVKKTIKQGVKTSFAISYWFVFGLFILIGWIGKGAGLGITLLILFSIGFFTIVKVTKMVKKAQKRNGSVIES